MISANDLLDNEHERNHHEDSTHEIQRIGQREVDVVALKKDELAAA